MISCQMSLNVNYLDILLICVGSKLTFLPTPKAFSNVHVGHSNPIAPP